MKTLKLYITLLCMTTLFINAGAQEKYSLIYKFEKGKSYEYKNDMSVESIQEVMGNEMKVSMDGFFLGVYFIESVSPDGGSTCLYSLKDAKIHTVGMGSDTTITLPKDTFDTTRIVFAKNGKTISNEATDTSSTKKKKGMVGNLENTKMFELPQNPVAVGETWTVNSTDTTDVSGGQLVTITNTTYTLTGIEEMLGHKCLRIEYKGTNETTGKMNQMGMDMFIEGTGEPVGTAWFDAELGLVIKTQSVMSTEMTMAMTGQNQMTIPMSQKISMTQTFVE
jgi:hypothetical protein